MAQESKSSLITQTVKKYGSRLMSFILPKVSSREDAEDVLQDVWYQLSNITQIGDILNLGSWLYKVSNNKITDLYRKKRPERLEDFFYEDEDGELNFSFKDMMLLDNSDNPELTYYREEIWKRFNEALLEMPEKQSYVFIENELNDRTLHDIAAGLGENIKTIISRKQYAVKHLRKRLAYLYEAINT
ncbi:MAG: sigma-70 family RNA polymerase sigma factor [Sphingobacteriales bacterium]|nr:MAG: sigma-70 family RNA polymerase sigma factor [Sphingobacteriales bacterium]